MPPTNVNGLLVFLAAAKLGVSQPALSHTTRGLEERLGLWLLVEALRYRGQAY